LVLTLFWPMPSPQAAPAFSTPVLLSPTNGAVTTGETDPPNGTPTFAWLRVSGATSYQIQISTSSGFSQIVKEETTTATTYTPDVALADGTYYWRVRGGHNQVWGPFSQVRMFRKDWSAGGRLRPRPITPTPGAVLADFNGGFEWTPVPGAAHYLFEIGNSPHFTHIDYSALTLKPAHTPTQKLGNGHYYWRVTPIDPKNNYGMAMQAAAFTLNWHFAPSLLSPTPNATLAFLPPFEWTAVSGAKSYILQVDTDPSFTNPTVYQTMNTAFTPENALSNDADYYWRVQAVDNAGNSGPFSPARRFRLRWEFSPTLLTPTNNWVSVSAPTFRWTPVPGAYQYQFQVSDSVSFAPPLKVDVVTYFTHYTVGDWGDLNIPGTYYWRVRALDAGGSPGPWSHTFAFSFAPDMAPEPLYPTYYYDAQNPYTPVHTRVDVSEPLFLWNTAHDERSGRLPFTQTERYVLEVDDDPLFTSPNFRVETAALGAAPTDDQPFTNFAYDTTYYWRVTGYVQGKPLGHPTVWVARFSRQAPGPATAHTIHLLFPGDNTSWSVNAPVLGWTPVKGAQKYRLQVSLTPDFSDVLYDVTTSFTHFVPGQDRLDKLPHRTYWWRVRTEIPQGDWSAPRSFRITHRLMTGNPHDDAPTDPLQDDTSYLNRVLVDETGGTGAYNLDSLWVVQDRYYKNTELRWILDLVTYAYRGLSLDYVIYVDVNHTPDAGAASDPQGRPIRFPSHERPDVAISLHINEDGTVNPALLWTYGAQGWGVPQDLNTIGAEIHFDPAKHALQLFLPYTAMGGNDPKWDGALGFAVAVFDADGNLKDIMPGDASSPIPYFEYTSDLINPVLPFDLTTGAAAPLSMFPLLRWQMPSWDSVDGYRVEVARDRNFTDIALTWEAYENSFDYSPMYGFVPTGATPTTPPGDNETYYWRVQVRHEVYNDVANLFDYGPFSAPSRFTVRSLAPANLQPRDGHVVTRTPLLRWDRVENAGRYRVQMDNDANFSSPILDIQVEDTAYINPETFTERLKDGTFYWRVAVVKGSVQGPWSDVASFVKVSPAPRLLTPADGAITHELPTLRWQAVLTPTNQPRLAAPLYRVELDTNPNFSAPQWFITDATSFTPPSGNRFPDGTWYWRVAMLRDEGTEGPFSLVHSFYKEYPTPHVVAPANGSVSAGVPMFVWDPIPGAAFYRLELSQDANFSMPSSYRTDNTRFTPPDALTPGLWYWRVQMVDAEEQPGPFAQGMVLIGYRQMIPYVRIARASFLP